MANIGELLHLDRETEGSITNEQMRLTSGEIGESEYEYRYEAIMDHFRLRSQAILDNIARREYEKIYITNPLP